MFIIYTSSLNLTDNEIVIRGRDSRASWHVSVAEAEVTYEIQKTNSCVVCYVRAKNMYYPHYYLLTPFVLVSRLIKSHQFKLSTA